MRGQQIVGRQALKLMRRVAMRSAKENTSEEMQPVMPQPQHETQAEEIKP